MRVLILANADSGLYRFRLELLRELLLGEHEVFIALPDGPFIPEIKALGCRFINTPFSRRGTNPIKELRLFINYRQIIKDVAPDAVLTYTVKPNVYGGLMCRMLRVPYLPNITGLGASIENGGFLQKIMLFLYRAALKKAACVFFQNQENLDFMMRRKVISAQKHRLIPGSGVNTVHFYPLEYPTEDQINFLFIGRIMEEKGIEQYLEAAEYIKSRYPHTSFHILGGCEERYESKLKAYQARELVIYHGVQDDIRQFHRTSHCTIHPSYWEGMSNVLLESASCARPILAADISGCREVVDDGVTGFLFERKNSAALISAIERFLALDWQAKKQLGLEGRKKVESAFDRKIVVKAYTDALRETGRHGN